MYMRITFAPYRGWGGLVLITCFIDVELALPSAGKLMIHIAVSIECRDQR